MLGIAGWIKYALKKPILPGWKNAETGNSYLTCRCCSKDKGAKRLKLTVLGGWRILEIA